MITRVSISGNSKIVCVQLDDEKGLFWKGYSPIPEPVKGPLGEPRQEPDVTFTHTWDLPPGVV